MSKKLQSKKFHLNTVREVIYASNGKKYLDFVQGIAVNSLGHTHPQLVKTINRQSKALACVNAYLIPEGE